MPTASTTALSPAAMFIWWPDVFYHTPDDEVEVIEPEKLKTVGVLSAHTLAALAEGYVELEQTVERLQARIATGDREAFLEGLDPTDPDLRAAQAAWFDNLWSRELTGVTIETGLMRVGDGEADVTLRLTYRWADATGREPSVSYDAHFVQRDGTWTFAGYELDELSGDVFSSTGIPTVKFIWDEAERDFYMPTDTADHIDPDRLAFSGEILTLISSWLARQ